MVNIDAPFFNEFVAHSVIKSPEEVNRQLRDKRIIGGLPLGRFYAEYDDCLLITVTETKTKADIDRLCEALALA